MKKIIFVTLILTQILVLTGCKENKITIAVPNDLTNEARALLLLDDLNIIKVDRTKGLNTTKKDIIDFNNIKIVELSADQIPSRLKDFDYAVVNGNYALNAKITDKKMIDCSEKNDSESAIKFGNIIAAKSGNEKSDKTVAVLNALKQENIKTFIEEKYQGSVTYMEFEVFSPIKNGNETTIKIGASSIPHAEILKETKPYLKEHGYNLEIVEFNDYVLPNMSLSDGSLDLNYFQHEPYLNEFNDKNKTEIKSVAKIHFEPLALYSAQHISLQGIILLNR